jgi:RNA polymerase sigma-70 factor (ECF subfamily)
VDAPLDADREERLLEEARRDPEAFRDLYRCYLPRVYGYVASRVARVEDAQDLVAQAVLHAVQGPAAFEYRGDGSFAAWLFRIAHNLVGDFHRRNGRRGTELPLEHATHLADAGPLPDEEAVRAEEGARLRRLVGALPPRRREVVALRFFGRLRNREIATVLGLDERTVASHLCRALEDLQRSYRRTCAKEDQRDGCATRSN